MADGFDSDVLLEEGSFLGSYRILRRLAKGTYWDIYEAKSGSSHRQVALRVRPGTLPELAQLASLVEIDHPSIARIYEAGSDRGFSFVAQELVTGPRGESFTLAQELYNNGGRLPEERVRILAKQLLEAFAYAQRFRVRGIIHGSLSADRVILTGQRRVKVLGFGFGPQPDDARLEEAKAEDIVALGTLINTCLTGNAPGPAAGPPSGSGVGRIWDRIVADCLSARPGALPDLDALKNLLLSSPGPVQRRRVPLIVAMFLAVALVLGGVFFVRRTREIRKQEAVARVAAEEREQAEQVRKYLDFAQAAAARMNYEAARKAVDKVLTVNPDHVRARQILDDIRTAEGLAAIADIKNRAEEAWGQVRDLDGGQGMQARCAVIEQRFLQARKALADLDFTLAGTHYRWIVEEAGKLLAADGRRHEADQFRRQAEIARDGAELAGAEKEAAELWGQGVSVLTDAEKSFSSQEFDRAGSLWKQAESVFTEARRKADGCRRVRVARAAYEAEHDGAGETVLAAVSEVCQRKIDETLAAAEAAVAALDWDRAEALYDRARDELAEGIAEGTAKLRKQHYAEAMKTAKACIEARDFASAEDAIEEALGIEGYGNDDLARNALTLIRKAQLAAAGSQSRPGKSGNLVMNGMFSEGKDGCPIGWQKPDRLTVFWDDDPQMGKAIRMDTDVYRSEWEAHRLNPDESVKKTPTSGTRYNTVAGTAGVALYSRPIPVEAGACYLIQFDVKGVGGEPFLYVKGYWRCAEEDLKDQGEKIMFRPFPDGPEFSLTQMGTSGGERRLPKAGDCIQCFRRRIVARFPTGEEMQWRRFKSVIYFDPARHIELVLLELYAFWPPGEYWFDNVAMKQVTQKELEEYENERKRLGTQANFGVSATDPP